LAALRKVIKEIAPNKVQLNTAVRPVAEDRAQPLTSEEMAAVAAFLGEGVEVIAASERTCITPAALNDAAFLEVLSRRPMTALDLAQALGLPLGLVQKKLRHLKESGRISYNFYHDQGFYRI
jgi:wyosine [tRNA(Phe)-imidazoG37] synthetase (radical SAM superfamily)